jgi:hypothetical protein
MSERHRFVVMLEIEASDPRLSETAISAAIASNTAKDAAALRRLIMQSLPKDVVRVIAMFPTAHAKMLMQLHEAVGEDIADFLQQEGISTRSPFHRPPKDYVPPTRD